jgi:OTU domain-containing protein 3
MVESLPNLNTSQSIARKMTDECNGSVSDVALKLIDSDEKSTTPSTQGSSSVERDSDSDDEDPIRGPNKRRDRRLSRATRIAVKESDDRNHDLTYRPKGGYLLETEEHTSKPLPIPGTESTSTDEAGEDDWRGDAAGKDSESASLSTSASDISVVSKPRSGAVRLRLSQPKKDGARAGTPFSNYKRPAMGAKPIADPYGNAHARHQNSPKPRRLIQRNKHISKASPNLDESDYKKAMMAGPGTKPLMTTQGNERTPAIETHIKVLYI